MGSSVPRQALAFPDGLRHSQKVSGALRWSPAFPDGLQHSLTGSGIPRLSPAFPDGLWRSRMVSQRGVVGEGRCYPEESLHWTAPLSPAGLWLTDSSRRDTVQGSGKGSLSGAVASEPESRAELRTAVVNTTWNQIGVPVKSVNSEEILFAVRNLALRFQSISCPGGKLACL